MSYTGKKYFDDNFKRKVWDSFILEIKNIKSSEEAGKLLSKVLTEKETILLEKRLIALHLLGEGLTYRQISEIADIHQGTISAVKKGFRKNPKIKKETKKKKESRIEKFLFSESKRNMYGKKIYKRKNSN